jgi:hypothetical protein
MTATPLTDRLAQTRPLDTKPGDLFTWHEGWEAVLVNTPSPIVLTGRQALQLAGAMLGYEPGSVEALEHFEEHPTPDAATTLGQLGCLAFLAREARVQGVDPTFGATQRA